MAVWPVRGAIDRVSTVPRAHNHSDDHVAPDTKVSFPSFFLLFGKPQASRLKGYVIPVEGKRAVCALPVAPSRAVALGSIVATVGFPDLGLQGFSPKLAKGEIASLCSAADDPRYFQISVPVQPGNSGGVLVDDRGNVIGIVTANLPRESPFHYMARCALSRTLRKMAQTIHSPFSFLLDYARFAKKRRLRVHAGVSKRSFLCPKRCQFRALDAP